MGLVVLSVLIQVLTVVHIIRHGRNQAWVLAAVMLSIPGCIAYFVIEVAPGLWGGRTAAAARGRVVKALDPERELRAARDALDLADTPLNHARVADALVELDRAGDAVVHYEAALGGIQSGNVRTLFKLASALLDSGNAARALQVAEPLPTAESSDGDRNALLRAKILEALGRAPDAMRIYADLVTRVPGEEVRCRYANLLMVAGRTGEARQLLREVGDRARRLSRQQRADQARMYDWAASELVRIGR